MTHQRTKPEQAPNPAVSEINKRAGRDLFAATVVGLGLLAIVGCSLVWLPWGFAIVVAIAVAGIQIELSQVLARLRGTKVVLVPLVIGSVIAVVGVYGISVYELINPGLFLLSVTGLTMVVVLSLRLLGPIEGFLNDVTTTGFLLLYPCLLLSTLMMIMADSRGPIKIAVFVVAVAGSDTGGYAVGVLIGKHRFSPRISPNKSWEGVAGSFILAGAAVSVLTIFALDASWWKGLVLSASLVVVATAGDLVESVIKRDLGIKDMGSILVGHGGLMDRLDSYVLSALPAYLLMLWLFPQ